MLLATTGKLFKGGGVGFGVLSRFLYELVEPGHINFFIVLKDLANTISIHIRDHADSLKCVLQNERLDITGLSLFIDLIVDLFDGSSTDRVCHDVAPFRLIISHQHLFGTLLVLCCLAESVVAL